MQTAGPVRGGGRGGTRVEDAGEVVGALRDLDVAGDALASARLHDTGRRPRQGLPKVSSCLSGQIYLTKI